MKVKPCNIRPQHVTRGNNHNLEQLAAKGDALSASGRHEQAYSLYQEVYEGLLVMDGEDDPSTLAMRSSMGLSLFQQNRHVEAHIELTLLLPKLSSVFGDEHPLTLRSIVCLAETLYTLERHAEALAMLEMLLPRQVRIQGEDHDSTIATMNCMAWALFQIARVDNAHRTASRGLLLARKVGNDLRVAQFVKLLSRLEQQIRFLSRLDQQALSGGGKGEQKKKSSKPAAKTDGGGAVESGGGKVKACAVCMSTVKTKACSGCKQVFYVSWINVNLKCRIYLTHLSPHRILPFYSTHTVRRGLSTEALEGTQGGLQG
jgi:tetratricopeptide (TPR) repeat protein